MSAVVDRLEKGPLPPATVKLVIPEGLWLSEIRTRILRTFPLMKPAALDHALATVRSKYEPAGSNNLEGLLFPATYQVLLGDRANPTKLVRQMVTAFDQQADSIGLSTAAQQLGLHALPGAHGGLDGRGGGQAARRPGQGGPGHLQPAGQRDDARHRRHRRVRPRSSARPA